jgi:deoxyribonuclease V
MSGHLDPEILKEAAEAQRNLAIRVRTTEERDPRAFRTVGGCDCAYARVGNRVLVCAVAVIMGRDSEGTPEIAARSEAVRPAEFPYIPGFLSFRELPALLEAIRKLPRPEAWIVDGAGLAHPRRFGLACHLGVTLDLPAAGCAKSRLVGHHGEPGPGKGDRTELLDRGERIGLVLRSRPRVRPLFVSPGHRLSVEGAAELVLAWTTRYRLPEPTRIADRETKILARRLAEEGAARRA